MTYRALWATLAVAFALAAIMNYHAQQLSYHVTVPKRTLVSAAVLCSAATATVTGHARLALHC